MPLTNWKNSNILKDAASQPGNEESSTQVLEANQSLIEHAERKLQQTTDLLDRAHKLAQSVDDASQQPRPEQISTLKDANQLLAEFILAAVKFIDDMYPYIDESEAFALSMFNYPEPIKKAIVEEAHLREEAIKAMEKNLQDAVKIVAPLILTWCQLSFPNQSEEEYTLTHIKELLELVSKADIVEIHQNRGADRLYNTIEVINLNKQLLEYEDS